MFKLVIQDDEGKTTVVPLIRDEITIGRKEGNTIRLTERNVSRRHARILRNNGEVQIEDLGSYNGIRVNNARIAERVSLRISDQVQIGDYKLYLKAEGVEQVDDARTMPIERIDNALPTEVMAAVQPTATGTGQVPAIPATPAPNRSPVAVADTDPAGRPVATAAQVAALTTPVGYGKLVVVSSNFAGKEFDLTRPQMIIGRTDENDIVVNHRSISRNHAKVTRDPETGRYTISDLQSSNGVRVNGQDYGKVELRRGDTVDLGHVRLRFVEPGEDFVFARDAVIADVPETGGKKGLLVAIILGVVVLGGVGAFFALKGAEKTETNANKGSDTNGLNGTGGGSEVAVIETGSGSGSEQVITPEVGSGSAATTVVKPPTGDEAAQILVECQQNQVDKKWTDMRDCATRLMKHDPDNAKRLLALGKKELEASLATTRIAEAVRADNLKKARKDLESIDENSVYHTDAKRLVDDLEDKLVGLYGSQAAAMKAKKDCAGIDRLVGEARDKGGPRAASAVTSQKCEKVAGTQPDKLDCSTKLVDNSNACKRQFCKANGSDPACSGGGTPTVAPPPGCDADALKDKGMENVNMGQHAAALAQFEASLRCKPDSYVLALAFMASCNAGNAQKAKYYYTKLTPVQQTKYQVMCIRNKVPYQ
jgi:pSer/pThr/pTyr-binding forkhead associated (FHA) protein